MNNHDQLLVVWERHGAWRANLAHFGDLQTATSQQGRDYGTTIAQPLVSVLPLVIEQEFVDQLGPDATVWGGTRLAVET